MRTGWRVTFIHNGHQHIYLVGIKDQEAAKAKAVGDRSGISRVRAEEVDDIEKFGLLEGQIMEGHGSPSEK